MAVKIGSARNGESGKPTNNKAGDQTGKEVSAQNWYLHEKGWRVFRCKDPAKAEKMAKGMQAACDNRHVGYDQWNRHTLYTAAKAVGFDISKVTKDVETDCSALIRVLLASVGISVPEDFRTGNMPGYLLKSGQFVELTGTKYQAQSAYLRRGDILVTRTSGHTVMVLSDGPKAEKNVPAADGSLRKGDSGADVAAMQRALLEWDGKCLPQFGADGDFGAETEKAVKAFQKAVGLPQTGVCDAATKAALAGRGVPKQIEVTGGLVNVRAAPNTSGRILGVVKKGQRLEYQGQTDAKGWHLVAYENQNAWISGKYGMLMG